MLPPSSWSELLAPTDTRAECDGEYNVESSVEQIEIRTHVHQFFPRTSRVTPQGRLIAVRRTGTNQTSLVLTLLTETEKDAQSI